MNTEGSDRLEQTIVINCDLDYFNKRWVEYLGVSLDDVEGWKWTAWFHPDDVEGVVERWRACLVSGEIFEHEARVRRADGEYRRMRHRKVPLRDEQGKILKWYGSSVDIEDYKRSESYLADGQRLAHMGSWAFDAAGFDYWSPELFRMHGLEPASQAPTVQEYLDCVHPQDRESMAELIRRILAEPSRFDTNQAHRATRASCNRSMWQTRPVPMIDIRRRHKLGLDKAKRLAQTLARRLQTEFGGTYTWKGNMLHFQRTGVSGSATVTKDSVRIRVELGLLLRPLRARIEREVHAGLDAHLGHEAVRGTGHTAQST